MDRIDNIQQYKIYVDAIEAGPGQWLFLQEDRSLGLQSDYDFYLPVFLRRTYEVYEYVDVAKQEDIIPIERQEFNPYFKKDN